MKLNNTMRTASIILGILLILGGFIWQVSAFTTKVEYKLQQGVDKDAVQDSSITIINSKMDYLVQQARLKEIIDSLYGFDKIKEAKEIMKNSANINISDTNTTTVKEWSTDNLDK